MVVPFILDTDLGTDVDDALALAYALRHPELSLRAVTTVSGDTVRRARIAQKLLALAGRLDIPVLAGETGEVSKPQRQPELGHEDAMLADSTGRHEPPRDDAIPFLAEVLAKGDTSLATVGMQSNLAALITTSPDLARSIPLLVVMGGVFGPVRYLGRTLTPTVDHNLNVDQSASLIALGAGIPTLYVPCDVTMTTWLSEHHVGQLRRGDPLCRELARQIDIWNAYLRLRPRGAPPAHLLCQLHDPLAVACLVERRFVELERLPVTVALHDGLVRTFVDPATGVEADVARSVDAFAFADHWLEVVMG